MNIPAVGARVRLRGREGVVSPASLGTVKRLGDEFVSSGAWIEVMLTDGKGHSDLLKLHEGEWDDSSCSTPERSVVALFGRVLARQSGRLWDHGADRRRDAHLRAPGRSLRSRLAAARLAALLIPLAEDLRLWGAGQQCFELGPIKRLALHEDLADAVEEITLLGEQVDGALVRVLDDAADLVVDLARDLVRVVGLLLELAPQERHRPVVAERARAELLQASSSSATRGRR